MSLFAAFSSDYDFFEDFHLVLKMTYFNVVEEYEFESD